MATIIIKNSTGSGVVPASLMQGELAINTKDGKLFYGSGSGNVVKEFTGSGGTSFPYTGSAVITGSLVVTGSTVSTLGFTGSLQGTSSWADSASQALTASFAPNYVLTSDTSSMLQPYVLTSQTSSMTVATASFVTGSNVVGNIAGNANNITAYTINQNLGTTNQVTFDGITASLQGTSSWAYSASQALTASFLPVSTYNITASWAQSALQAITASYVTGSIYDSTNPALSASYALTASYALNGGTTDTGSLLTTASVNLNTITFTKGDGSTFPITVNTGSGGSGGTNLGLVYAVSLGYLMP